MKLLSENLLEFQKGLDPVDSLGMSRQQMIKDWLDSYLVENYVINDDLTIDVDGWVSLDFLGLKELPEFIQFGTIDGRFYIFGNKLTTLRGCPKYVINNGFWCNSNKLTSLVGCPKYVGGDFYCSSNIVKFTDEYVRSLCNVKDAVYV